ncbi:unnamed protein product [Lampetra fluviatilis]
MGQLADNVATSPEWKSLVTSQVLISLALICMVFLTVRAALQVVGSTICPVGFPPGPKPLPLLGNITAFSCKNPHIGMQELAKKYGEVCTIMLGSTPVVLVSGYQAVKEVLVNRGHEFADRPITPIFTKLTNNIGIALAPYGDAWKQQRRFALSTLRNFGFGKATIADKILIEATYLIETFKQETSAFDPHLNLNNAVGNIICSLLNGIRYDYNDEQFQKLTHIVDNLVQLQAEPLVILCNVFPFLLKLPGPWQKVFHFRTKLQCFLNDIVSEHRATRDQHNPRDLIDSYLAQMDQEKDNPNSSFTDQNLIQVLIELFIAGLETTSNTIRWGLLFMMMNPDIQARCHEEIDRVVGSERLPCMKDRRSLPYLDAVIHEIQRFGNVVPLGVLHATSKDVQFHDYLFPKGTHVMVNLMSVLHDDIHWKTPNKFNPDHFLDKDGQCIQSDAFLPFSAGPRVCLGESLAKMELFIFFTSLLQHFEFYWPNSVSPPTLAAKFSTTLSPHPYKLGLRIRNSP